MHLIFLFIDFRKQYAHSSDLILDQVFGMVCVLIGSHNLFVDYSDILHKCQLLLSLLLGLWLEHLFSVESRGLSLYFHDVVEQVTLGLLLLRGHGEDALEYHLCLSSFTITESGQGSLQLEGLFPCESTGA